MADKEAAELKVLEKYLPQALTEDELKAIDDKINVIVEASVKFAEESPLPDPSEVLKDVYIDQNYPFIVD